MKLMPKGCLRHHTAVQWANRVHQNRSEMELRQHATYQRKSINRNLPNRCTKHATREGLIKKELSQVMEMRKRHKNDWQSVLVVLCNTKLMLRRPDRVCFCSLRDCDWEWPCCLPFPPQRLCHCQQSTWHNEWATAYWSQWRSVRSVLGICMTLDPFHNSGKGCLW